MNLESFVAKQVELLELERDAEIEEEKCLHERLSLKDLQKKGVCIPKLHLAGSYVGLYGRFINDFKPLWPGKPLPCHNIRSGDIVGIGHFVSDGKHDIMASGVVTRVEEELVSVALENSCEDLSVLENDMQYMIIKLANDVTYKCLIKALKHLKQGRGGRIGRLIDVLFGDSKPTCGLINADISFYNKNLNRAQSDAVKFALSQKEVSLVHGPPGTGKTATLVEIIMQAVGQKLKVLACAPSNVAVDNLVEKLSDYKVKMIRLGHPARFLPNIHRYSLDEVVSKCDGSRITYDLRKEIDEIKTRIEKSRDSAAKRKLLAENRMNLKELKDRERSVVAEVLKQADVILCTLTSATSTGPVRHLPKDYFDIAVIDECSQALEVSCWISLLHAPKCVLAGDHHQLPPTIVSNKAAKGGLGETLMERLIKLHGNDIVKMLTIQYRMHEKIMKWPSEQLYSGKLEAHASVVSHLLRDIVSVDDDDDNTAIPLLLVDTAGCNLDELDTEDEDSKGNEGEADLVYCHVQDLVRSGVAASDIAVITPYRLQVDLVKSRLLAKYPQLEIKSVDGFQGREKEAIILSLVRSNSSGDVGFLAEDRRINVAVTRARRHLAVIANSETVSHHPFLKSFIDYIFAEGEVRSASQYEKEIGQFPKFQGGKSKKLTQNGNNVKASNKTTNSHRKNYEENTIQKDPSGEADNMDRISNCNSVEFKAARSEEFQNIMKLFVENSDDSVLKFPSDLSAFDRKVVHEISEEFGLLHTSQGIGSERYIEVKKVETSNDAKNVFVEKNCIRNKECSDCSNKEQQHASTDNGSQSHDENFISACDKNALANKSEFHNVRSEKVKVTKQKKKKSGQTNPKTVEASKIESASSSAGILSDADFDAIIEETIKTNSTCAQRKCKKSITTLGQECQFCRSCFCYSHFLPEIHGCGDAAKAQARHQLKKEGTLYPGSGKPHKNSDAVKHAHLQHRLSKKLTELSNQRKGKPKH